MDGQLTWNDAIEAYRLDLDSVDYTSVATAVVRSVATLEDAAPRSLVPLYERVDPVALDAIARHGDETDVTRVQFRYQGYRVTVLGTDELRLAPAEPRRHARP